MTPAKFPESNAVFGPPADMTEEQVRTIPAYRGQFAWQGEFEKGSCDGAPCVVVAYQLTKEEIEVLANGGLLYFTMMGGLAPHFPSLSFDAATHPA